MLKVKNVNDSTKDFQVIDMMTQMNHEQLVFCNDKEKNKRKIKVKVLKYQKQMPS